MLPRSEDLAAAFVDRAGAVPETAGILARLVIDAAYPGGNASTSALPEQPSTPIPALLDKFRVAYPALFVPAAPSAPTVPEHETTTARVNRLGREADARAAEAPLDRWRDAPVTRAVMLKAGRDV